VSVISRIWLGFPDYLVVRLDYLSQNNERTDSSLLAIVYCVIIAHSLIFSAMASATASSSVKASIRSHLKMVLSQLSPAVVEAQSGQVAERLTGLGAIASSDTVCIYLSMPTGEIQTYPLVKSFLDAGKRVFIPKVTGKRSEDMVMFEVSSYSDIDDFPKNRWGIPEPSLETVLARPDGTTLGVIRSVIVPGVAFDTSCARLGHGKGYYDSFLSRLTAANEQAGIGPPVTFGLALEEQMVDAVPMEKHDWHLDYVVLPSKTLQKTEK